MHQEKPSTQSFNYGNKKKNIDQIFEDAPLHCSLQLAPISLHFFLFRGIVQHLKGLYYKYTIITNSNRRIYAGYYKTDCTSSKVAGTTIRSQVVLSPQAPAAHLGVTQEPFPRQFTVSHNFPRAPLENKLSTVCALLIYVKSL